MILHTVVFAWRPEVDPADVDRLELDLRALAADLSGVVSFDAGRDGGFRPGAADFVVVAKFEDESALYAYLEHPAHHKLLDDYARDMVARKESVQARV